MIREKNFSLQGSRNKSILIDVYFEPNHTPKPVVIFGHGYKGFKDWGAWGLVADEFAKENYFFVKFNFSHNGGTVDHPMDFPDLEAFANDNFTKQLDDLETVINWISTTKQFSKDADVNLVFLIGHSRGGGIVLLKAAENKLVKKVVTWAGVSDFASRFPSGKELVQWKKEGVYYVENSRTKQQMPHYFQFFEDFQQHKNRLNIKKATKRLSIPQLIVHAKGDPTVGVEEAKKLHQWNLKSELFLLEDGNHVFGAKHPWGKEQLPVDLQKITEKTIEFLRK